MNATGWIRNAVEYLVHGISLGAATDRIAFRASFLACKIPLGFIRTFAPCFLPAAAKTAPTDPSMAPIGGTWAGWSCAYSVSGVPLQVPADLCPPRKPAAGFRELTTELYLELQAPATGAFVERRVTKLMPNDALPVQTKAGRLAQLHALGRALVQDSHYKGDVFVLQTLLPGRTALERRRLALLFDSSSGELVRGMRAWWEVRCAGGRFAELAGLDGSGALSSGALAATWAAAELPACIGGQGWAAAARSRAQPPSPALSCPPRPAVAPSRAVGRAEAQLVAPSPAASNTP